MGLKRRTQGGVSFSWQDAEQGKEPGRTAWALFPKDTKYVAPSQSSFMVNYRVDDLDALLTVLKEEGVETDEHREDYDYGRFAWIMDPEGNRIELWERPKSGR